MSFVQRFGPTVLRVTAIGTVLQVAMVVAGHYSARVAMLFGPLGMTISLLIGALFAFQAGAASRAESAGGGAVAGGACALIGIALSLYLGDVTPALLAFGTASSGVTGALGGLLGHRLVAGRRLAAGVTTA